jgi:predicted O-methyltransferase YrrM
MAKFASQKFVQQQVFDHVMQIGFKETAATKALRLATATHPRAVMMGDPVEAALFGVLLPSMNCKKVIEVGVFTGYTTRVLAECLQSDGIVVALDITDEHIMKELWKDVQHKIDLRIGPAVETLKAMVADENNLESYDFAFIDADKSSYKLYYELLLKLLRPNGLIAIDNVLWGGKVLDDSVQDEDTVALREISMHVHQDSRVVHVMLPFADGVTLVRKK